MLPLTVVIVNFRTPDLTGRAVHSLRSVYPSVPLLLIDNGSGDADRTVLETLVALAPGATTLVCNQENRHHGPAMDQAARLADSPFLLFLDSDCEIRRPGLLEAMLVPCADPARDYAVGKKVFMNDRGFDGPEGPGMHPYLRPICLLIRRSLYLSLPPFERHGAPCLTNFLAADRAGYLLHHFPVEEYVHHVGRGTASRFGYRLGWGGKLNHLLNKIGL